MAGSPVWGSCDAASTCHANGRTGPFKAINTNGGLQTFAATDANGRSPRKNWLGGFSEWWDSEPSALTKHPKARCLATTIQEQPATFSCTKANAAAYLYR